LELKQENESLRIELEKFQKDVQNLTEDKNEMIAALSKNQEEEVKRLKTIIHQQRVSDVILCEKNMMTVTIIVIQMLIESLKRKPIKF